MLASSVKTPSSPGSLKSIKVFKKVAELIKSNLRDPARVQVEGKGSDMPLAKNDTAEGKSTNRRVEVIIARARE